MTIIKYSKYPHEKDDKMYVNVYVRHALYFLQYNTNIKRITADKH